jgi:hypothetical protein
MIFNNKYKIKSLISSFLFLISSNSRETIHLTVIKKFMITFSFIRLNIYIKILLKKLKATTNIRIYRTEKN